MLPERLSLRAFPVGEVGELKLRPGAIVVREGFWNPRGKGKGRKQGGGDSRGESRWVSQLWPPGTPSFPDSRCLTSSFLAETLSHMRPSAEGLSQGILREKGAQLQEGQRCPQGKAFLPPTPETVCLVTGPTARAWGSEAGGDWLWEGEANQDLRCPEGLFSAHFLRPQRSEQGPEARNTGLTVG